MFCPYGTVPCPPIRRTPTFVFTFANNGANGAYPRSSIAVDKIGQLYGTASSYGSAGSFSGQGAIFELTYTYKWLYGNIHSFTASRSSGDGGGPWSGLTADANGNFYGTTTGGGQYGYGVVFKLTAGSGGSYTYSTLYSFTGGSDGANPYVPLTFDAGTGYFYGTTVGGGANGKGAVFMLAP